MWKSIKFHVTIRTFFCPKKPLVLGFTSVFRSLDSIGTRSQERDVGTSSSTVHGGLWIGKELLVLRVMSVHLISDVADWRGL